MSDCIIYTGYLDGDGYGARSGRPAHRIAYERTFGPIPPGMDVDHLCFVRACVNVEHLRLLSVSENRGLTQRSLKTRCYKGHPLDDEANVYRPPNRPRRRICRACRRVWYGPAAVAS